MTNETQEEFPWFEKKIVYCSDYFDVFILHRIVGSRLERNSNEKILDEFLKFSFAIKLLNWRII